VETIFANDLKRFEQGWAEYVDEKYVFSPVPGRSVSRADFLSTYQKIFRSFPDFGFNVDSKSIVVNGDQVVFSQARSGTHTGEPFAIGGPPIARTDKKVGPLPTETHLVHFSGNKIVSHRIIRRHFIYSGPVGMYYSIGGQVPPQATTKAEVVAGLFGNDYSVLPDFWTAHVDAKYVQTKDDFMAGLGRLNRCFPDFAFNVDTKTIAVNGDVVTFNLKASGTHSGDPFAPPNLTPLAASGKKWELEEETVEVTFAGDKVVNHKIIKKHPLFSGGWGVYRRLGGVIPESMEQKH